jgi:hypothetical protein
MTKKIDIATAMFFIGGPNNIIYRFFGKNKVSFQTIGIPKTAMACIRFAELKAPIVWWRKPYGGLHAGMVYLPRGDMREARNRAKFHRWGN